MRITIKGGDIWKKLQSFQIHLLKAFPNWMVNGEAPSTYQSFELKIFHKLSKINSKIKYKFYKKKFSCFIQRYFIQYKFHKISVYIKLTTIISI